MNEKLPPWEDRKHYHNEVGEKRMADILQLMVVLVCKVEEKYLLSKGVCSGKGLAFLKSGWDHI